MKNHQKFFRSLLLLALMTMSYYLATAQDPCAPGCTGACGPDYLHVNGMVRTNCLQVDGPSGTTGITAGYVLTAVDACGNVEWLPAAYGPIGCTDPYNVVKLDVTGLNTTCSDIWDIPTGVSGTGVGVFQNAPQFILDVNGTFQSNQPDGPTGATGNLFLGNNTNILGLGITGSGASYTNTTTPDMYFAGVMDNSGLSSFIGYQNTSTGVQSYGFFVPSAANVNYADPSALSGAGIGDFLNMNSYYLKEGVTTTAGTPVQTYFQMSIPDGYQLFTKSNSSSDLGFSIINTSSPYNPVILSMYNNGTLVLPLAPTGGTGTTAATGYVMTSIDALGTSAWMPAVGATGATGTFGATGCTGSTLYYDPASTSWESSTDVLNPNNGYVGIGLPSCDPTPMVSPLTVYGNGASDNYSRVLDLDAGPGTYGSLIRFDYGCTTPTDRVGSGNDLYFGVENNIFTPVGTGLGNIPGFVFQYAPGGDATHTRELLNVDYSGYAMSLFGYQGKGSLLSLGDYDPGSGSSADPTPRQLIVGNGTGNLWGGGSSRIYFSDESDYFAGASGSNTSLTHLYISGPGYCDGVDRNVGIGLTYLSHGGTLPCPNCDLALTQPYEKLDVDGNLFVEGYNNLTGGALVNGCGSIAGGSGTLVGPSGASLSSNPTGNVFATGGFYGSVSYTRSDARFKKDVQPLTNALNKIKQLQGVSYNFKTDEFPKLGFGKGPQIGFIAQDVQKVVPEVVGDMPADREHKGERYLGIEYGKLTALLVEGIKEQQQTIDAVTAQLQQANGQITTQNAQLAQQNTTINQLADRLTKLEQQVNSCVACATGVNGTGSTVVPSNTNTANGSQLQQVNMTSADMASSSLSQNVPNPFTNTTVIAYKVVDNANVAYISIADMSGKEVKNISVQPGPGSIQLNFNDLPAATLSYSLFVNGQLVDTRKMVKITE